MRARAAITIHPGVMKPSRTGFTLIEVLVVVAIIALLVSILLPSLARAKEASRRAICASRLHNMGVSVHEYSHVNKGKIIECMASSYVGTEYDADGYGAATQVCIAPRKKLAQPTHIENYVDWQEQARRYHLDKELWECPNRPGSFLYEGEPVAADQGYDQQMLANKGYKVVNSSSTSSFDQWMIGYQYFGGIKEWRRNGVGYKAASPVDSNAKPQWALAADSNIKIDGQWGGGAFIRPSAYSNMPPHPRSDGRPEGGNVLTFDGAVNWIRYAKDGATTGRVLRYIHGWHNNGREGYWWQADMPRP